MNQRIHFSVLTSFVASLGLLILISVSGCAHSGKHTRGSVVLKHNEREGDVCIGETEVKSGDRVNVFRMDCREGAKRQICSKVKVGEGEVLQTLSEDVSTLRVDSGVPLQQGFIVEKQ